jgi:hypothetical protein
MGFDELGAITHKSPMGLTRMLGLAGNAQVRNLFEIVAHLQESEGRWLTTRAGKRHVLVEN